MKQFMIEKYIIISSVLFFCIIFILFLNYSIEERENIHNDTLQDLLDEAEKNSNDLNSELNKQTNILEPAARILSDVKNLRSAETLALIREILIGLHFQRALIAFPDGEAIDVSGNVLSLTEEDFFTEVMKGRRVITESDAKENSESCLVIAEPIIKNDRTMGAIILYYPLNQFASITENGPYGTNILQLLTNKEGVITETLQNAKITYLKAEKGAAIFDILEAADFSKGSLKKMKESFQNKKSGIVCCQSGEEQNYISYAPLGDTNYYIINIINYDFVKNIENMEWIITKQILVKLAVCFIIYISFIIILSFVSRNKYALESMKLITKAETDELTQLLNKAATENAIKEYMEYAKSIGANNKSLLFILDIDNFKKINDTRGHAFGDEVLHNLGLKLKSEFRISDVVGRTGGDEFLVFLKDLPDLDTIKKEGKKVEDFFRNFKTGEYVKYSVTASIGAAVFPSDGTDFEELYKSADKALYKAKERGKNQLAFYNEDKESMI